MSDDTDYAATFFHNAFDAFSAGNITRLDHLAKDSPFPCGTDGWLGRHWLTSAIDSHNPDAVAWVLGKHPQINYVDADGFTALKSALQVEDDCKKSHGLDDHDAAQLTIRMIDLLLAAGADISLTSSLDETVLHTAAMWSSADVVRHLLQCGADPLAWDGEYTPQQPVDYARSLKKWDVHATLKAAMPPKLGTDSPH